MDKLSGLFEAIDFYSFKPGNLFFKKIPANEIRAFPFFVNAFHLAYLSPHMILSSMDGFHFC